MAKATYISPREHINLLKIEAYKEDTAFLIKNLHLKKELINEIHNIKDRLFKALSNIPNLSRVGSGQNDLNYYIAGEIFINETDIFNNLDENEKDFFKLVLKPFKYNELKEKGCTTIIESPQEYNAPRLSFTQRITNANKKAIEIIDACDAKINEYKKELDPYQKKCKIDDGILYFKGDFEEFGKILFLMSSNKQYYMNFIRDLNNKVFFENQSRYLKDTDISKKYTRYEGYKNKGKVLVSDELLKVVSPIIEEVINMQ